MTTIGIEHPLAQPNHSFPLIFFEYTRARVINDISVRVKYSVRQDCVCKAARCAIEKSKNLCARDNHSMRISGVFDRDKITTTFYVSGWNRSPIDDAYYKIICIWVFLISLYQRYFGLRQV